MANPKKRRKIIILSAIGVGLTALTMAAIFSNREPVITVQLDKVTRRNLTEIVVANGRIQPVTQVHISPEVSGEIIELPVKEGQHVRKGDLILKIKPDFYIAALNQAKASYEASLAARAVAEANVEKAGAEYKRNKELFDRHLISESDFIGYKAARDVSKAQLDSTVHQVDVAKASVDSVRDSLGKTTIVSPLDGTVSKLNSQLGERVLGTAQNVGTDIMIISDLNEMEARVDIGEVDVVLIAPGQKTHLEVDAFKDRKFNGTVTEIARSAKGLGGLSSSGQQDATKFEVHIRIAEKEMFLPGMSVTAEIETRYRTNALAVPFASVTARPPREPLKNGGDPKAAARPGETNAAIVKADPSPAYRTNAFKSDRKTKDAAKPVEVVFIAENGRVKLTPVKIGISDDAYWEITEGLMEGQEIVSGGYRAITRDLDDGKKIKQGVPEKDEEAKKQPWH